MKRTYGGVFIEYFLMKEPFTPLYHAYGIRYSEHYGAHLIKTSPITSINRRQRKLYTVFKVYTVHHLIDDESYKALICSLFEHRHMPTWDEEMISTAVYLSIN